MPNQDLCYLPAIEPAAAIRARRLSPVELQPTKKLKFAARREEWGGTL